MSNLFWFLGWIFDWRVIAVASVIVAVFVWRLLGTKATAALVAAAGALVLSRWAWQRGARSERQGQVRRDAKAVATRDTVRKSVESAPKGVVRERLARWAPKD